MEREKTLKIIQKLKFEIEKLSENPLYQEYKKLQYMSEQGEIIDSIISQKQDVIKLNTAKLNGHVEMQHQYAAQKVPKYVDPVEEDEQYEEEQPQIQVKKQKKVEEENPFADDDLELEDDNVEGIPDIDKI